MSKRTELSELTVFELSALSEYYTSTRPSKRVTTSYIQAKRSISARRPSGLPDIDTEEEKYQLLLTGKTSTAKLTMSTRAHAPEHLVRDYNRVLHEVQQKYPQVEDREDLIEEYIKEHHKGNDDLLYFHYSRSLSPKRKEQERAFTPTATLSRTPLRPIKKTADSDGVLQRRTSPDPSDRRPVPAVLADAARVDTMADQLNPGLALTSAQSKYQQVLDSARDDTTTRRKVPAPARRDSTSSDSNVMSSDGLHFDSDTGVLTHSGTVHGASRSNKGKLTTVKDRKGRTHLRSVGLSEQRIEEAMRLLQREGLIDQDGYVSDNYTPQGQVPAAAAAPATNPTSTAPATAAPQTGTAQGCILCDLGSCLIHTARPGTAPNPPPTTATGAIPKRPLLGASGPALNQPAGAQGPPVSQPQVSAPGPMNTSMQAVFASWSATGPIQASTASAPTRLTAARQGATTGMASAPAQSQQQLQQVPAQPQVPQSAAVNQQVPYQQQQQIPASQPVFSQLQLRAPAPAQYQQMRPAVMVSTLQSQPIAPVPGTMTQPPPALPLNAQQQAPMQPAQPAPMQQTQQAPYQYPQAPAQQAAPAPAYDRNQQVPAQNPPVPPDNTRQASTRRRTDRILQGPRGALGDHDSTDDDENQAAAARSLRRARLANQGDRRYGSSIRIPPYKGGNFNLWEPTLMVAAEANDWDDEQIKAQIFAACEGPAKVLLNSKPYRKWKLDDMLTELRLHLGKQLSMAQVTHELDSIRLKPGEKVADLMVRIDTQMVQLAPSTSESLRRHRRQEAFVRALQSNLPMYYHVHNGVSENDNPKKALELAIKFEQEQGINKPWVQQQIEDELTRRGLMPPGKTAAVHTDPAYGQTPPSVNKQYPTSVSILGDDPDFQQRMARHFEYVEYLKSLGGQQNPQVNENSEEGTVNAAYFDPNKAPEPWWPPIAHRFNEIERLRRRQESMDNARKSLGDAQRSTPPPPTPGTNQTPYRSNTSGAPNQSRGSWSNRAPQSGRQYQQPPPWQRNNPPPTQGTSDSRPANRWNRGSNTGTRPNYNQPSQAGTAAQSDADTNMQEFEQMFVGMLRNMMEGAMQQPPSDEVPNEQPPPTQPDPQVPPPGGQE